MGKQHVKATIYPEGTREEKLVFEGIYFVLVMGKEFRLWKKPRTSTLKTPLLQGGRTQKAVLSL